MAFSLHDHFTNLPDEDEEAYHSHPDDDQVLISRRYDFEETYDGLGDRLDETLDEFNDETFGAPGTDVGIYPCKGRQI
jgi:Topoisomerase II-associated protein PAT1